VRTWHDLLDADHRRATVFERHQSYFTRQSPMPERQHRAHGAVLIAGILWLIYSTHARA